VLILVFELALLRDSALVWLILASVLATSPLGVLAPIAGMVDWAYASEPARLSVRKRPKKRFIVNKDISKRYLAYATGLAEVGGAASEVVIEPVCHRA
jgi:hypothetical protein